MARKLLFKRKWSLKRGKTRMEIWFFGWILNTVNIVVRSIPSIQRTYLFSPFSPAPKKQMDWHGINGRAPNINTINSSNWMLNDYVSGVKIVICDYTKSRLGDLDDFYSYLCCDCAIAWQYAAQANHLAEPFFALSQIVDLRARLLGQTHVVSAQFCRSFITLTRKNAPG